VTAPPPTRPEDRPLHEDVRRLADGLGRTVRRLDGEAAFEAVERLRRACRARRHDEPDAPSLDRLLDDAASLPLPVAASVARAFTLFFLLINTAEQVHRVRRRRAYDRPDLPPQAASPSWTLARLREAGHEAAVVRRAIAQLEVRPVLTAHPTESARRTLIALQARLLRAARAFLDPGLQLGEIDRETARRVLEEEVVFSPAMANQEVERYTFWAPGQAPSYFCGYQRLMELRTDVERMLGERFDRKAFHDFLLAQGLVPPALLRQAVMDDFVAPRLAAAGPE